MTANSPTVERTAPIALIGGTGALPAALVAALAAQGRPFGLWQLAGFPFEGLGDLPRETFRLEHLAETLDALRARGVGEVCLAGAIRRPDVDLGAVTPASAPLVARLAQAMTLGDDGALRAVVALFEERGFRVVGAADIAPDLLPAIGLLGQVPLPEGIDRDIAVARAEHVRMAARDMGQALVVRQGRVIATEGPEGTDAMLAHLAGPAARAPAQAPPASEDPLGWAFEGLWSVAETVTDWAAGIEETRDTATGGILYKAPKAGQDRRVDLPVIGPATVMAAAAAGVDAIAIEAGGVMVLDADEVVALADGAGLAVVVRE